MSDEQYRTQTPMPVRVLYFEGCPNHPPTVQRICSVAERLNVVVDLQEIEVKPDDDPHWLGFRGSPTVQVYGVDLDPAQRGQDNCGFGCRTYGGAGVPDEGLIEAALTDPPGPYGELHQEQQVSSDCCSACGSRTVHDNTTPGTRSSVSSSVAAFGSAVAASACCWLPLLLVGLGLSFSLGGLIDALHVVRPYLLIVAGLCLVGGFYVVYFKAAPQRGVQQVALWTALVATLAMALFPYYSGALFSVSNVTDSRPTPASPMVVAGANSGDLTNLTYKVEGMTCGGCEAAVCSAMSEVPGVKQCRASYEKGRAWATVSKGRLERGALMHAVEGVGFSAKRITE